MKKQIIDWWASGTSYEPESVALFAAMTVQPSAAEKTNINNLIAYYKNNNSVWDALEYLAIPMQSDNTSNQALLRWDDPTKFITNTSAVWAKNEGLSGVAASSNYYRTGFNPSTGVKFTQNSNSVGVWFWQYAGSNLVLTGSFNGSSRVELTTPGSASNYYYIHFASDGTATNSSATVAGNREGFAMVNRKNSSQKEYVTTDKAKQVITSTSAARPNLEAYGLCRNLSGTPGGYATATIGLHFYGQGLTDAQVDTLIDGFTNVYLAGLVSLNFNRFYALGDSLTAGSGSTGATKYFPYLVGVDKSVTQVNFGVGSEAVQNEGSTLGFVDRLTQFKYYNRNAIMNILGGSNDIYYYLHPTGDGPTYANEADFLVGFRAAYDSMLDTLISYGYNSTRIYTNLLPWCTGERQAYLSGVNGQISASSAARGITCIDLYTPTLNQGALYFDAVHLNDAGYQVIADTIEAILPAGASITS